MKIGVSLLKEYDRPITEIVKIIKDIGFDAVSPQWTVDVCEVIEKAKTLDLEIQSLHGPYSSCVGMWREAKHKSDPGKEELIQALELCRKYDIPIMVTHIWLGFDYTFGETSHGITNYGEVIEKAREYGIKIAFENTEGQEYLTVLLDTYADDTVGFCWDSGHENCYNRCDMLSKYGERMIMTHLNDNIGMTGERIFWTDDLHLLPYDGNIDWDNVINRLKNAKKQDILNFELKFSDRYYNMSYEEYYKEAYNRAKKIITAL